MKKITFLLIFVCSFGFSQVGIGTTNPTGALDVSSTLPSPSLNKAGFVPPTVALSATNSTVITTTPSVSVVNPATNLAPVDGTIVYNTNTSAPGAFQVTPGFYFYRAGNWEKLTSGANTNWSLSGNASTTPGTNYIGTSDSQALVVKTDNTERMRVEADGDVAIGTPTATHKLSVRHDQDGAGVMSVDNATAGGFSGIYFQQNTAYRGHIGYVNTGGTSTFGGKGMYQLASGDRPMIFSVSPVGSELFSERLRINQVGNVGINTTNPTAKLEIDASADTVPALEIVPRTTAPTGTASGQISVIDGSLYIYDATRAKWLSSETMVFPFGKNGAVIANEYLQYARVENQYSGAKVLQNATIVGITSEASGGNPTKSFDIIIKTGGTTTTVSTTSFSLAGSTYLNSTANINLSAGDYISIQTNGGSDVNNPTVTLYVKWRK